MKKIDPLFKVKLALEGKLIDDHIFNLIIKRKTIVEDGICRIKKLTNIEFPQYFIEPGLLIGTSPLEYGQFSIIYARTIPICNKENKIEIYIQLFTPLIIYGLRGTIHSVIAHEFLHYLDLLNKIINVEITSDTQNNTLFENIFSDNEKLFDYNRVFKKDKYLTKIITNKFENGFNDERLNNKSINLWIQKGLPTEKLPIESNHIKLSFSSLVNTEIDEEIKKKIANLL
ncbi:MAG: hypothetical protein H0X50_09235 [Nitrosopumilus sp.]|nr:hypothetical protein [Nitrosopumilus sp.]